MDFKCKHCGKTYKTLQHLKAVKCQSHPKGMWKGNHECDHYEAELATYANDLEKSNKEFHVIEQMRQEREEEIRKRMEKRPVFFPESTWIWEPLLEDILNAEILQSKINVNLRELSVNLFNHWNEPIAKNTIEDFIQACQWAIEAINNESLDEENRLYECDDDDLKYLKEKITSKYFWGKIFLFMELKYQGEDLSSMSNRKLNNVINSVLFHFREKGKDIVQNFIEQLIAMREDNRENKEKASWEQTITEMIDKDIKDDSFWFDLYNILRLKIRP